LDERLAECAESVRFSGKRMKAGGVPARSGAECGGAKGARLRFGENPVSPLGIGLSQDAVNNTEFAKGQVVKLTGKMVLPVSRA